MMRGMVIDMNDKQLATLAQLQAFVNGTAAVDFSVAAAERYEFIARTVRRFGYQGLKRTEKAVVLRFLERVSGYSRQQLTRLVKRGGERAPLIKRYHGSRSSFACTYTSADVALLAATDTLHGTLSGLATKKLMERACHVFADARYKRLATLSVGHLYNLRKRSSYQRHRQVWTKTRAVSIAIGERRAPAPNNRPGYLRVDSVHQGDQDGAKGLYHINAVDCVTQYEAVATCERISEAFLIPVLEALLQSFPFTIQGFHSDNGSEYINHDIVKLLNKLLIEEHTKSRSRHSNDNALAESKNASIVREAPGLQPYPATLRFPRERLLPRLLEPVRELPSAMSIRPDHHRCQGSHPQALSLQTDDDALRQTQITAPSRTIPQDRHHLRAARCTGLRHQR